MKKQEQDRRTTSHELKSIPGLGSLDGRTGGYLVAWLVAEHCPPRRSCTGNDQSPHSVELLNSASVVGF